MNKNYTITAACPLYACRVCHTKTGYPHQQWCTLPAREKPDCRNCSYLRESKMTCGHPYNKKAVV